MVLCIGFLQLFGLEGLADVGEAGTASAKALFGPVGVLVVTGLILLAMLGSLNGTVLTGSRIAHAMAKKGDCWEAAGTLHARFQTPTVALWLQAGIAMALLFTGSHLDQLIAYTSSAMLITGTLTVLSVVVLRRRMPSAERPYRTWLYPLPPVLYAGSSLLVLVLVAAQGDPSVWVAALWFGGALAVYAVRKRRRAKE
jgi:APA family basic amino acid/polyamine antiporter